MQADPIPSPRACPHQVRKYMCEEKGLVSVAAPGFESPGVVVVHTEDSGVVGKFIDSMI